MKSILVYTQYHPDISFWKGNEDLLLVEEMKSLYEGDNSEDKMNSSKIMWGIYFAYDYASRYSHLSLDIRLKIVCDSLFGGKKILEDKKYKKLIEKYIFLQRTSPRRLIDTIETKLEERRLFLDSVSYNINNAKDIDTMIANSSKLLEQRDIIIAQVNKDESRIKGGTRLGLLASGKLES